WRVLMKDPQVDLVWPPVPVGAGPAPFRRWRRNYWVFAFRHGSPLLFDVLTLTIAVKTTIPNLVKDCHLRIILTDMAVNLRRQHPRAYEQPFTNSSSGGSSLRDSCLS